MAPGTRRANRGAYAAEHDDFEGLPVRQWRQEVVPVLPPSDSEPAAKGDIWGIELPYGMPKDSHLLMPHSQELLRAARSGALYKRPAPEDDEGDDNPILDKPDKKEEDPTAYSYSVRMWRQVPRNAEDERSSHLAKRHKSTITLPSKYSAEPMGTTITRATVRKIDAAGNPYTQEVMLAEGEKVDGEIISTSLVIVPQPPSGVQVAPQAAPNRRRPPPTKKRRGRKKKPVPESGQPAPSGAPTDAAADGTGAIDLTLLYPKSEPGSLTPRTNNDDDDDEGDDDGDDGDEGDTVISESVADVDHDMTDAPDSKQGVIASVSTANESTSETLPKRPSPPQENSPPTALSNPSLSARFEGSPLKNVVVPSPTEQSPRISPASLPPPVPVLSQPTIQISESQPVRPAPQHQSAVGHDEDVMMDDVVIPDSIPQIVEPFGFDSTTDAVVESAEDKAPAQEVEEKSLVEQYPKDQSQANAEEGVEESVQVGDAEGDAKTEELERQAEQWDLGQNNLEEQTDFQEQNNFEEQQLEIGEQNEFEAPQEFGQPPDLEQQTVEVSQDMAEQFSEQQPVAELLKASAQQPEDGALSGGEAFEAKSDDVPEQPQLTEEAAQLEQATQLEQLEESGLPEQPEQSEQPVQSEQPTQLEEQSEQPEQLQQPEQSEEQQPVFVEQPVEPTPEQPIFEASTEQPTDQLVVSAFEQPTANQLATPTQEQQILDTSPDNHEPMDVDIVMDDAAILPDQDEQSQPFVMDIEAPDAFDAVQVADASINYAQGSQSPTTQAAGKSIGEGPVDGVPLSDSQTLQDNQKVEGADAAQEQTPAEPPQDTEVTMADVLMESFDTAPEQASPEAPTEAVESVPAAALDEGAPGSGASDAPQEPVLTSPKLAEAATEPETIATSPKEETMQDAVPESVPSGIDETGPAPEDAMDMDDAPPHTDAMDIAQDTVQDAIQENTAQDTTETADAPELTAPADEPDLLSTLESVLDGMGAQVADEEKEASHVAVEDQLPLEQEQLPLEQEQEQSSVKDLEKEASLEKEVVEEAPIREALLEKEASPIKEASPEKEASPIKEASPEKEASPIKEASLEKEASIKEESPEKEASPIKEASTEKEPSPNKEEVAPMVEAGGESPKVEDASQAGMGEGQTEKAVEDKPEQDAMEQDKPLQDMDGDNPEQDVMDKDKPTQQDVTEDELIQQDAAKDKPTQQDNTEDKPAEQDPTQKPTEHTDAAVEDKPISQDLAMKDSSMEHPEAPLPATDVDQEASTDAPAQSEGQEVGESTTQTQEPVDAPPTEGDKDAPSS